MNDIDAAATRLAETRSRSIEQACEAALQGGEHGVLVIDHRDGSWTVTVDESVPYGTIHNYPHGQVDL